MSCYFILYMFVSIIDYINIFASKLLVLDRNTSNNVIVCEKGLLLIWNSYVKLCNYVNILSIRLEYLISYANI